MQAHKFLRILSIFLLLLFFQTACNLDDPSSSDDEPGVLDYTDLTTIKGFLTYGTNNYVSNKKIIIHYAGYQKEVYTNGNGFYKATFEPGTKHVGENLPLTLYAQKPGEYIFSEVYNSYLEVGSTITININLE